MNDNLHDSFINMIQAIKSHLLKYAMSTGDKTINHENDQTVSIKVSSQQIAEAIKQTCKLAIVVSKEGYALYIEDPDQKIMRNDKSFIFEILSELAAIERFTIKIDDLDNIARKVISILKHRRTIPHLNPVPSQYLITKDDVVIDLKNKKICDFNDIRKSYDITSKCNISLKNRELFKFDEKKALHREIINRVMSDWSNNDDTIKLLLWQIIFSVLQNDNHKKCFVLTGPGGNGKSTYMSLLAKLAGQEQTLYINIHQFGDSNSINTIDMRTRVIIGDDAATNHKISDTSLSNLKSFVTHNPFSVNVKYESNRIILSKAVFVQGTNTDINFYENNPAIQARLVVIPWTTVDYRKSSDLTFNLDELLTDHDFISEWAMMCIENIEWFDQFEIPEIVEKRTNEMIESNDTIKQFLDETLSSINAYGMIPTQVLYQAYVRWSKFVNSSSGVMKINSFTKALIDKQKQYKFELCQTRRRFTKHNYKYAICRQLDVDDKLMSNKQTYLLLQSNELSYDEIEKFRYSEHPKFINELTERQIQIINYLKFDLSNTFIASIYNDI